MMATYTKTVKGNGTTDWADGDAITHTEFNAEFDGLITDYNGNIDEDNISASAQILNSSLVAIDAAKVTDHADDDATFLTVTSPGDTATTVKPTDLEEELEALRYRIGANKGHFSGLQYRNTGGSMVVAGWTEPPITGRNMFPNPGFEVQSGVAHSAPDGWSKLNTPSIIDIESAADPEAGIDKRSVNIVAAAADDGLFKIVKSLKPSTKYLVGMQYTLTTGSIRLITQNALGSGDYQNLAFIDSSTSSAPEIFQGIVKTDSTPTDITVSILSNADLDDFNIYKAWFYEMSSDAPSDIPHIPMQTATDATELEYPASPTLDATKWEVIAPLSLSQYVPYVGYRFIYEVTLTAMADENKGTPDSDTQRYQFAYRIKQDGVVVQGPVMFFNEDGWSQSAVAAATEIITLKHIEEYPTASTTYDYTVEIGVFTDTATNYAHIYMNPLKNSLQSQSSARLYTERI